MNRLTSLFFLLWAGGISARSITYNSFDSSSGQATTQSLTIRDRRAPGNLQDGVKLKGMGCDWSSTNQVAWPGGFSGPTGNNSDSGLEDAFDGGV